MIAQAPRRADDDMRAFGQSSSLLPAVHAADAGDDARASVAVEPVEFALHLDRQFARRRDDQRQRSARRRKSFRVAKERRGDGETIGHGLAGPGLGGDENVAPFGLRRKHSGLHRRRVGVVALFERTGQRRAGGGKCHFWDA